MSLPAFPLITASLVLVSCGAGGPAPDLGADADVPTADAATADAPIADAAVEDPHVRWGGAGTGCPRPATTIGTEILFSRIDLEWNADVSVFQERGASSLAISATPIVKTEHLSLATLEAQAATVTIAPLYLNVGLSRVVYAGTRSINGVSHHPERVCFEGVASAETSGGLAATVVYTDALTIDSHVSGALVTVVLGANDGIVLTYPAAAGIVVGSGLHATPPVEVAGGIHQRRLGTGSSTAYVTIPNASQIQVVPDLR